ncbi:MAG: transcriptional regulator [Gammaproteobacteria bacterium]
MRAFRATGLYFDQFRFDPRQRALYKHGRRVALRAKAAEILHVLLHSADEVVSKQALRERVWGHDQVADQSLFQAISDVRRALAPLEAVMTHPNQGYRFALPVRQPRWSARALAAGAVPLVAAGLVMLAGWQVAPTPSSGLSSLSPSMQAFANGVAALKSGDAAAAESLLSLALLENSAFLDARLMLGEAFLAQGQLDQALTEARHVLTANEARAQPDTHATVAAMALISRAESSAGAASRALHWAFEAAQRAHRGGLVCTASEIENRIDRLLALDDAPEALPRTPAAAAARLSNYPVAAEREKLPAYCAEFSLEGGQPEARIAPDECEMPTLRPRLVTILGPLKSMV